MRVFLVLLFLTACAKAPEEKKTEVKKTPGEVKLEPAMIASGNIVSVVAEMQSQAVTLRVNGRLTANEERTWHVDSLVEGRVMKLMANVGDRVSAGQVLAELHSHDVHEARSEYQKAKTDLARVLSQRTFAERSRDRMKRLYELKAASQEQTEHAESAVRDAQAAVTNAETELKRTREHLTEYLDVGPEANQEDGVPVKTRNAGIVTERKTSVGAVVKMADELYQVSDLSSVWMIAALPEASLGKVRVGMTANVTVQAYEGEIFKGTITRMGDAMDAATRTAPVRISLPNPGQRLRPEMYAAAEIAAGGSVAAVYVPQSALQDLGGQAMVFVDKGNGVYASRPVRPGRTMGLNVEIVEGLQAGEKVVARGGFVLKSQMFKSSLAEE